MDENARGEGEIEPAIAKWQLRGRRAVTALTAGSLHPKPGERLLIDVNAVGLAATQRAGTIHRRLAPVLQPTSRTRCDRVFETSGIPERVASSAGCDVRSGVGVSEVAGPEFLERDRRSRKSLPGRLPTMALTSDGRIRAFGWTPWSRGQTDASRGPILESEHPDRQVRSLLLAEQARSAGDSCATC